MLASLSSRLSYALRLTIRANTRPLQPLLHHFHRSTHASPISQTSRRFFPSHFQLDGVEDVENYRLGGYHPVSIGDSFSDQRYRVLHKLGYGGSSTVWLARDQEKNGLVALKIMRADASPAHLGDMPALAIPRMLRAATVPSESAAVQTPDDHFFVCGPNGLHLGIVFPFAGPSIGAMNDCPGRMSGSRRLRADLARKVAGQAAVALGDMHRAGFVHGDLTTSNILFALSPRVLGWPDADLYAHLGEPETAHVQTLDGSPIPPNVPPSLVAPISTTDLSHASYLQESIILSDFGQSYAVASPPPGYSAATALNYASPETRFEGRGGLEADVWMLGCAIFEIRAGRPLFEVFFGSDGEVLEQMVSILGPPPESWQSARDSGFEERGGPRGMEDQGRDEVLPSKSSIREQLRSIGAQADAPYADEGRLIERYDKRLREEEVVLLGDLLERMLKYRPEERIKMEEVVRHPWFKYTD